LPETSIASMGQQMPPRETEAMVRHPNHEIAVMLLELICTS